MRDEVERRALARSKAGVIVVVVVVVGAGGRRGGGDGGSAGAAGAGAGAALRVTRARWRRDQPARVSLADARFSLYSSTPNPPCAARSRERRA